MLWLVLFLILAVLGAWFVVWWLIQRNVFDPQRRLPDFPEDFSLEPEEVTFFAEDRTRLTGLWFEHPDAVATILCCHGKSGNMLHRLHWVEPFHRLGLNVFLFDYRGYGASRGRANERGLYRDARAAYEVVRARHDDADEPPVLIYGRSLGSAVAVHLASERHARGLLLENAMTNIFDVGTQNWPAWFLRLTLHQRFDSLSRMPAVECPVLVAHSIDDEIIPFAMGQQLHAASGSDYKLVELRGTHDDSGWRDTPAYWLAIERFVAQATNSEVPA